MRSYPTTRSRGRLGGWPRRLAGVVRGLVGERLLLALLAFYLALCLLDHSLPARSIVLLEPRVYASIVALLVASRALDTSGLPSRLSTAMLSRRRGSLGASSILLLVMGAGAASMAITNDAALFVYIPIVASLERAVGSGLDWLYVVTALSVNVASMMSPVGNPQNIYIWQHYHVSAARFTLYLAPYTGLSLALLALYTLLLTSHASLPRVPPPPPVRVDWGLAAASISSIIAVLVMGHYGLQYAALALAIALIAYADPRALGAVDLGLLLVFALIPHRLRGGLEAGGSPPQAAREPCGPRCSSGWPKPGCE